MREIDALHPTLTGIVRPGDRVMWGQAAAEPTTLTRALMAQRAAIGRFGVFVGISWSDAVQPAHADHVAFMSYCGGGNNRQLAKAGVLDILSCHYSQLGDMINSGALPVDVLMLQLAPADTHGRYSLSMACEYLLPAISKARVIIAEVNDQAPWTFGPHALTEADIDYVIHTSCAPLAPASARTHDVDLAVARQVASLVEDGATLQIGIGTLPEAILAALTDRRDLGLHSGALGDAAAALLVAGVVTNARKTINTGTTVAGNLMGGALLSGLAHRNPAIELHGVAYTHALPVLAAIDRLTTINSAIEVDLTGQVNAEVAGGLYVGAVGGALDFMRGARAAKNGLPIVALSARVEGKTLDRIVSRLSGPVSTPRSDGIVVVTEHGIADLRGLSLAQRVPRMIAIAHPESRERLVHEARLIGLS